MSFLKSRKGSIPLSLERLAGRIGLRKKAATIGWGAFVDEVMKISVSEEDAIDAAKMLSESRASRITRYGQSAGVGAIASPLVTTAGDVAHALAGPKGKRVSGMAQAVRHGVQRPELAKQVTRGVLGGGALQAVRENVQLHAAKRTYSDFLKEHGS